MLSSPLFAQSISTATATDDSLVRLEGRFFEQGTLVGCEFPGCSAEVSFKGEKLILVGNAWSDQTWIDVIVDHGPAKPTKVPAGQFAITLFEGPLGAHQVKIVKRTEGWQGTLELQAFQVPNGQFQPPPALPRRKLLCIGDSITAGSGTDVKNLVDTRKDSYTSNGRLSYAYRLADRLDAQVHLIAFGGRGLIRDWQGKTDTGTAPQYYERTLATNTNYQWDQSRYQPDAISICLGTNDFNPGIIPPNEYSEAYASFVRKLHQDHPKAKIFLLGSPMFGQGDLRDSLNEAIDLTIQKVEELEGLTITKVDVGYYPGRPNVDSHPVSSEHRRIATELEPVFRQVLGW